MSCQPLQGAKLDSCRVAGTTHWLILFMDSGHAQRIEPVTQLVPLVLMDAECDDLEIPY